MFIIQFLLILVIPAGPDLWFIDVDTGIFLGLAVSSISVIGILMAGWASSSKYSQSKNRMLLYFSIVSSGLDFPNMKSKMLSRKCLR